MHDATYHVFGLAVSLPGPLELIFLGVFAAVLFIGVISAALFVMRRTQQKK